MSDKKIWPREESSERRSRFVELPPEVRLEIYRLLLVDSRPQGVKLYSCRIKKKTSSAPPAAISPEILRVSRSIYSEALPILYTLNKLNFEFEPHNKSLPKCPSRLLDTLAGRHLCQLTISPKADYRLQVLEGSLSQLRNFTLDLRWVHDAEVENVLQLICATANSFALDSSCRSPTFAVYTMVSLARSSSWSEKFGSTKWITDQCTCRSSSPPLLAGLDLPELQTFRLKLTLLPAEILCLRSIVLDDWAFERQEIIITEEFLFGNPWEAYLWGKFRKDTVIADEIGTEVHVSGGRDGENGTVSDQNAAGL
ncbi:MAG: hypothetical protein Q9160_004866 [Pyrenula sp. 1 TL-2023]